MTEDAPDDPTADVSMVAAALRADAADLDVYAQVLTSVLADALPAGMVEVERNRSVRDRLAGRPGTATALRVRAGQETLELTPAAGGQPRARVMSEIRGVVISRREVTITQWTERLASLLAARARESAQARAALAQLLGL